MCKWNSTKPVKVKIQKDLSCNGKEYWKVVGVDSCIASIVRALQKGGIDMRGSCCGHGKWTGQIHLQNGMMLEIWHSGTWKYSDNPQKTGRSIEFAGEKNEY